MLPPEGWAGPTWVGTGGCYDGVGVCAIKKRSKAPVSKIAHRKDGFVEKRTYTSSLRRPRCHSLAGCRPRPGPLAPNRQLSTNDRRHGGSAARGTWHRHARHDDPDARTDRAFAGAVGGRPAASGLVGRRPDARRPRRTE